MVPHLPPLKTASRTGSEQLRCGDVLLEQTLLDFWRWASSDLVSNTLRGVFAEYLVASALGLTATCRVEWEAFDLETPNGLRIEVKSAAYLQSWQQKALSEITFSIQPTRAWSDATSSHADEPKRQADIYIFCLLHHQDKATVDPLDMNQWTFYLLAASVLDAKLPMQKSISLASLLKLNPVQCGYEELAQATTETNY